MEQDQDYPGQWQSEMIRRVEALGYNGFRFGPGVRWWPTDAAGRDVAGPFTSTQEFDAWLSEQEQKSHQ